MNQVDFINETILDLNPSVFETLKSVLVGEYLSFSVISDQDVTKEILGEKACDYFETLKEKTNKEFYKYIENYIKDIDSIITDRIAKAPKAKKGGTVPTVPRARKYYEKAISIKNSRNLSFRQLFDYSRIMMCLYMAIINNEYQEIDNFNFSAECLEPDTIINSMKLEKVITLKFSRKRFKTEELYCSDTCTLIIATIMLYKIVNDIIQGDNDYE